MWLTECNMSSSSPSISINRSSDKRIALLKPCFFDYLYDTFNLQEVQDIERKCTYLEVKYNALKKENNGLHMKVGNIYLLG